VLRIVAYGVTVEVRVSHADLLCDVRNCLPPGWQPAPHAHAEHVVSVVRDDADKAAARTQIFVRRRRILDTRCWSEALHCLESHIQLHVAEMAGERIFVHAGVVGWRGKAILLPGRSFAGKSSLVAALLKAGAEYLSDEYAVCDSSGLVHPYPRRLSLREDGGEKLRRPGPEEFGSRTCRGPLPVGLIAMTKYVAGARWCPTRAPSGWAALALIDNMVPIRRQPGRCLHVIHRILAEALCLRGNRGEAEDAAPALLAAAAGHSASRPALPASMDRNDPQPTLTKETTDVSQSAYG
jgi:hypothetical protein